MNFYYNGDTMNFLGKRALVVEDDDDIRGLLQVVLEQMGFEVTAVETGAAGVASARASSPDLVTLDIGLPDVDGVAVLTDLRTFLDGTIVMISARGRQDDVALAMDAGATAYLLKPFRARALKEDLAAILDG